MNFDQDALLAAFLVEGGELLAEMERALMALEESGDGEEQQQLLLRHAHTLKGNASSVGLDRLTTYVHRFEDVLEAAREHTGLGGGPLISALLRVLDMLKGALAHADDRLPDGADEALAEAERLANGAGAGHFPIAEGAAILSE